VGVVFYTNPSLGGDTAGIDCAGSVLPSRASYSCPPATALRYIINPQRPAQVSAQEMHLLASKAFDLAVASLGTQR